MKTVCYSGDAQLIDFCEFGLRDPENKLPHKRSTALLATFQLNRASRQCSGHNGKAHQWTKGRLSKRYGNVSRLGYSQKWTPQFCRDLMEDWVDHVNPIRTTVNAVSRKATDTYQLKPDYMKIRSTCGTHKKIAELYPVGNDKDQCGRCQAEEEGRLIDLMRDKR